MVPAMVWPSPNMEAIERQLEALARRFDHLSTQLSVVIRVERTMSQAMDALRASVEAERSVSASAITLLRELHAKLDAALQAEDVEALQKLADDLKTSTQDLAQAVQTNTPADPMAPPSSGGSGSSGPQP